MTLCKTTSKDRIHPLLWGILSAHCAYAALFILRSSFVVAGERYFCLVDDAMISMRYARHLAAGHGWVWNPGAPPVEGYTNPLWCLLMAVCHFLPLPLSKVSLLVQMASEVILLTNVFFTYRLALRYLPQFESLAVTTCLAFYYPLNNWSLQGMEVGALALCATSTAWLLVSRPVPHWSSFVPAWLAVAIRPDGVVLHAVSLLLAWLRFRRGGRALVVGLVGGAATFAGWTFFRRVYYGDWLPNTYYLKMTGFPALLRATRGAFYAAVFWGQWVWPLLLLLGVSFLRGSPGLRFWRNGVKSLAVWPNNVLVAFPFAFTLYSIYVGGDAWERVTGANRFIAPAIPLAFLLAGKLAAWALGVAGEPRRARLVWLPFMIVFAINANAYYGLLSLRQALLLAPPPYREDNIRNVKLARWLEEATLPGARIAIDYAGTAPYFCQRTFVDLLGKSDKHVARQPARRGILGLAPWREFYPGHLKWDYAYSLGQLRPDVVCAIWRRTRDDSPLYLKDAYTTLFVEGVEVSVRRDSPYVRWGRIRAN